MGISNATVLVFALLAVFEARAQAQDQAEPEAFIDLPAPTGPYPVGVRVWH